MEVGIIYINYLSTDKVHNSLLSLQALSSVKKVVIVGDNSGEYVPIDNEKVIKFGKNLGFGKAVNACAHEIKVEYLAIINPDTIFNSDILQASVELFSVDSVGFVSAMQKSPITGELIPSFGSFPNIWHSLFQILPYRFVPKHIIKNYWPLRILDTDQRTFESCFGAYLFLSSRTFNKFKGFDERFFLYYEETDFCKRLIEEGYKNYILDSSHAYLHDIGYSSRKKGFQSRAHMSKSRYKYILKHHGFLYATTDCLLLNIALWKKIFQRSF